MKDLILVSGGPLTAEEQRILKFAHWMGVRTKAVSIDHDSALTWQFLPEGDRQRHCVVMSAATLARAHEASPMAWSVWPKNAVRSYWFSAGAIQRATAASSHGSRGARSA